MAAGSVVNEGATLSDYQVQQQQLDRKRALAQALAASSLQGGSTTADAGHGNVVANTAGPWGQVMKAIAGAYMGKDLDSQQADITKGAQAAQSKGIGDYLTTLQGGPQPQAGPPAEGQSSLPDVNMPGDAKKALVMALTNADPFVKQLGMGQLAAQQKAQISPEQLLAAPGMDANSRVAAANGGGVTALKPQTEYKPVNGQMVPSNVGGDYRDTFAPPVPIPGAAPNVLGQTDKATGKVTYSPPGSSTNISVGPKTETAGFESMLKPLGESLTQFKTNQESLQNISSAKAALAQIPDSRMGPLSDYQNKLAGIAQQFDVPNPVGASVQQLNASLGQNLIGVIRKFAPVSDTDAQKAMQIVGSSGNLKDALSGILDQQVHQIGLQMDQHQKMTNSAADALPAGPIQDSFRKFYNPEFTAVGQPPQNGPAKPDTGGIPDGWQVTVH